MYLTFIHKQVNDTQTVISINIVQENTFKDFMF